jgi:hypothetical protein
MASMISAWSRSPATKSCSRSPTTTELNYLSPDTSNAELTARVTLLTTVQAVVASGPATEARDSAPVRSRHDGFAPKAVIEDYFAAPKMNLRSNDQSRWPRPASSIARLSTVLRCVVETLRVPYEQMPLDNARIPLNVGKIASVLNFPLINNIDEVADFLSKGKVLLC